MSQASNSSNFLDDEAEEGTPENSFLTEEGSHETMGSDDGMMLNRRDSVGDIGDSDDDYQLDSFVVSDSQASDVDDSFKTASDLDSSVMIVDSPIVPREQPSRFAKIDLNTPRTTRSKKSKLPSDSLERVSNIVYVDKENRRTFNVSPEPSKPVEKPLSKGRVILNSLESDLQRELLLELYPELADDDYEPPAQTEEEEPMECRDVTPRRPPRMLSFSPSDEHETSKLDETGFELNYEYVAGSPMVTSPEHPVVSRRSVYGASKVDDDGFENYLKKLRESPSANDSDESDQEPDYNDDAFIVSDDDDVICLSSDSEEEPEFTDEESDSEEKTKPTVIKKKDPVKSRVDIESLKKQFSSPSVTKLPKQRKDDDDYFLDSLSDAFAKDQPRHPEAVKFVEKGVKKKGPRDELTAKLLEIFIRRCFDGDVAMSQIPVIWNVRLTKTAGNCRFKGSRSTGIYTTSIELSVKVNTTASRIRDTLIHELCHAANFVIDRVSNAKHGSMWIRWTSQCLRRCPSLPHIGVCHSHSIDAKYKYECQGCGRTVGRHSKSLDTNKKCCSWCHGRFVLQGQKTEGGVAKPTNKFAAFVKENYGIYKKDGATHKEVMVILSALWKSNQVTSPQEEEAEDSNPLDMSVLSIHG